MAFITVASGQVNKTSNFQMGGVRLSNVIYGGKSYSPQEYRRRFGSASFGSGGSGQLSGFQAASFVDPRIERQNQLVGQRGGLDAERAVIDAKTAALNRAVNLQARGIPIPGDTYAALGISPGQSLAVARGRIAEERNQFNQKTQVYNKEAQEFNVELAKPTSAEITARASLLDRGARVQTKTSISPMSRSVVLGLPAKGSLPEKLGASTARSQPVQQGNYFGDFLIPVFGQYGTGIPLVSARGSIGERGGRRLIETAYAGKAYGQRVGGVPGAAIGSLFGAGAGLFLGALEGGPGTAGQITGRVSQRATGSEIVGQTVGTVTEFLAMPGSSLRLFGWGGRAALKSAPVVPRALSAVERFAQRGKSVYAGETIFGRAATQTGNLIRGFESGLSGIGVSALYGGQAARVGAGAGAVLRGGARAIKQPLVKYPLLGAGSLAAPQVARGIGVAGETRQDRELFLSPVGEAAFYGAGLEGVRNIQASRGVVSQIGGELGLGAYGGGRSRVGGVSNQEIKQVFKQAFIQSGGSPAQAERYAATATRVYKTQQVGGIAGQIGLSIFTELGGTATIAPLITRGLVGKTVGLGGKSAFKQTLKTVAPTLPRFAFFGAVEGLGSTAIADFTQGRARGVRDLPRRIQQSPIQYALGGVAGAASAPVLGGLAIGGGVFRAFRGGKSISGKGTELGATYGGYFTDVFEKAGDDLARVFGKTEPSFRIRTMQGVPSLTRSETIEGRKGRPRTRTTTFFGTRIGIKTPFSFIEPITTPFPVETPNNVPVPQPVPVSFQNFIGTPDPSFTQNINENFQQNFQQNINQNIPTNTPINFNIPIGVPVSKAGFPPFFPASPFGEGRGRGGGRERKTYLNEFAFATGLLGRGLLARGRQVSRQRRSIFDLRRRRPRKRKNRRSRRK